MKKDMFDELVLSVKEGGMILRGEAVPSRTFAVKPADIRKTRKSFGLSQPEFAALLGISPATLRNWEQGRREPEGSAQVLLQVVAKHPEAVWDVVHQIAPGESDQRSGSRETSGPCVRAGSGFRRP